MTFAQHLDRLLAPTPQPTGWSMPDADQHSWFVEARALSNPKVSTQPAPIAPSSLATLVVASDDGDSPPLQPQNTPNQPKLAVWNDEQREALNTLSQLGADVHLHVTFDTARRQWRGLARKLHPDSATHGGSPQAFAQAAAAWDVLKTGPLVVEHGGPFAAGIR